MLFATATLSFILFTAVNGHGRLTVPATRKPVGYENDPVPSNTDPAFVCRNAVTAPATVLTAGENLPVRWDLSALHVGDCSFYVSYDWDKTNANMKWFKIANFFDCKSMSGATQTIALPDWLPAGRAVLRWEWYALHVFPTIEFYSQCADVTINAGANPVALSSIVKYSAINPSTLPASGTSPVGFRNAFNNGEQYMTGPPCALGYSGNNCALTAAGTTGHVDVGDSTNPQPTPQPATPAPTQQVTSPVATPAPSPSYTPAPTPDGVSNGCAVHVVQSGETLALIAAAYGTTWQSVCEMNLLANCAAIYPGEKLLVAPEGSVVRTSRVGQTAGQNGYQIVVSYTCSGTGRRRLEDRLQAKVGAGQL